LNPPDHAVVLCVDEKTSIQALDRARPSLPMRPGQVERRTHDYVRHGVIDLFAALNVATGEVVSRFDKQHRAVEFIKFLELIDTSVPVDLAIHVIVDNASTHKTPAVKKWLLRHPRFVMHFTPTSSSWLNLVERWFAELTNRKLRRSAHRSIRQLTDDLGAWVAQWNTDPKPFVWRKTADEILDGLKKYLTNL
jgi:transposase